MALLRHQLFLPSEVFITDQARALRRFAPLLVGRVLAGTPTPDLPYYVPPASSLAHLRYVLRRDPRLFLDKVAEHRPALVHAHFGVEAVYGMELADALDVPLVTTFHGFDATLRNLELLRSRKPSWIQYFLKRAELARRGALFIGVSNFIVAKLEQLGFPVERTRLHYIGVDAQNFATAVPTGGPRTILHVARLVEKKGTQYLLEAFATVAAKHHDAQLVIVGAGPLRTRLEQHAASLGIGARVRWCGVLPHSAVRRELAQAAVFCLPSCTAKNGDAEGLGMVVLEAAASGIPIVATQHGGIPEAVRDGDTGYLVPERDARALAAALDALLSSESLRSRMGDAGRELTRDRFDLQRQTGLLETLYEAVL